jgi:hypothetical protein
LPASEKGEGKGAFTELLQTHRQHPPTLQRMLQALWADMDRGGFCAALMRDVLRFYGKPAFQTTWYIPTMQVCDNSIESCFGVQAVYRALGGGALRGAADGAWHLDRATDHFLAYWAAVGPRRRACGRRGARAHRSRAIARWPRDARAPSRLQIRRRGAPLAMFARRA